MSSLCCAARRASTAHTKQYPGTPLATTPAVPRALPRAALPPLSSAGAKDRANSLSGTSVASAMASKYTTNAQSNPGSSPAANLMRSAVNRSYRRSSVARVSPALDQWLLSPRPAFTRAKAQPPRFQRVSGGKPRIHSRLLRGESSDATESPVGVHVRELLMHRRLVTRPGARLPDRPALQLTTWPMCLRVSHGTLLAQYR